jgi:hypothetical protein
VSCPSTCAELIPADRLVGAGAYPGVRDGFAQAGLLELGSIRPDRPPWLAVVAQQAGDRLQQLRVLGQRAEQAANASQASASAGQRPPAAASRG